MDVVEWLADHLTIDRRQKLKTRLAERTDHIAVVLEDIYDPHNASAVLRSCESFGLQDVHVIQMRHTFAPREGVTMGSAKWLNLANYTSTEDCYNWLKNQNYKIFAASPRQNSILLPNLELTEKIAVVFGSEKDGLTDYALKNADGLFTIPMVGFTESLNISVAAAITLYTLSQKMRSTGQNLSLSETKSRAILKTWIKSSLSAGEELEAEYYRRHGM